MIRLRKKRGGTLALVAAATITLILLGICFFFMAQIFGGNRELQHATDSGNLNVAKNALRHPFVSLNPGVETDTFGELGDRSLINGQQPNNETSKPPVNLLTYDRLVAQCLLACINAKDSSGPDPSNNAIANAKKMVDALQTGPTSIGGRLAAALSDKSSSNELFKNFDDTANQNSLRMLGKSSAMTRSDDQFTVSYLEQVPQDDIGATNIEVTSNTLKGMIPAAMLTTKGGKTYLRGYVEPAVGPISTTPVGVPMQPGDQPHLVSNKTFDSQISKGGSPTFGNAAVPPNGFRSSSFASEKMSGNNSMTIACAEVGSLNMTFPLSAPYGYIKIVNGPDTGGKDSVNGPFVGLDHVLNNELLKGGILVSGPVFSYDKNAMDQWAQYNQDPNAYVANNPGATVPPPVSGIYKLDGTPAKAADAAGIAFSGTGKNAIATGVNCTDANSTGWTATDPGVEPLCFDELQKGYFDKAYHPNGSYTTGAGTTDNGTSGGGLLSVECAKCQLQHRFNSCTNLDITSSNCPVTGLRLFTRGVELPSSPSTCQVSSTSNLQGLGNFVADRFGDQLVEYVAQRALQILPSNISGGGDGAAQATALLANTQLNLGDTFYMYVPNPDILAPGSTKTPPKQNGQDPRDLVMTTTPPPWIVSGTAPDGEPIRRQNGPYNITGTMVNPHHDRGIHDIMYREHPDSGINATDTATWTPSSGYQNLLGKVQFTDAASGSAGGFCKPD